MENTSTKIRRTKNEELIEAKKLTDMIIKKIFKDCPQSRAIPDNECYDTIEDLCMLHDSIYKIILRRNASIQQQSHYP